MKYWFTYLTITFLLILAFPRSINAQELQGAFIMSSIGGIQNMSNNSMAVTFNSNVNCFHIQNGSAVLTGDRGTGLFSVNCAVNTVFNSLGIKLYPNPVSTTTKVKFINPPPLEDLFTISVWNAQGIKIHHIIATGYEIYQGKLIDFSLFTAGTYVIQIESEKLMDALKFIKAN